MKINKEDIKSLIHKYFEGLTSLEEEKKLKKYFRQEEIPKEWREYQPIFLFFDLSTNKNSSNNSILEIDINKGSQKSASWVFPLINWISIAIASCLIIILSIHFFMSSSHRFSKKSQAFIDGQKYTELSVIQTEILKALESMEESNNEIYSSQIDALNLFFE